MSSTAPAFRKTTEKIMATNLKPVDVVVVGLGAHAGVARCCRSRAPELR